MAGRIFSLLLCLVPALDLFSQDTYFSNSNQALIYYSPSFAGTNGFVRSQSVYRLQDLNSKASFRTFYSAVDAYLRPIQGGIAFSFINEDQARGLLKSKSLGFAYSQHIFLWNKRVRCIPAFQAVHNAKTLDSKRLKFNDTIDFRKNYTWNPGKAEPGNDISFIDLNASLLFQNKDASVGVAMFHLNRYYEDFIGVTPSSFRMNVHAAVNYKLTADLNLSAVGVFITQGNFWDFNLNMNLAIRNTLFLGIGMRKLDAITTQVGFRNDVLRFSLGYDHGFGAEEKHIFGTSTFELMLGFNLVSHASENSPTADWVIW